jgi:hypothetical protein
MSVVEFSVAEFQSLPASGDAAQAEQPQKEPDRVHQPFLLWRRKGNPRQAAR